MRGIGGVGVEGWTAHICPSPQIPYSSSSPGSYTVSGAEATRLREGCSGCGVTHGGPSSPLCPSLCRDHQEEVDRLEHPLCPALEVP